MRFPTRDEFLRAYMNPPVFTGDVSQAGNENNRVTIRHPVTGADVRAIAFGGNILGGQVPVFALEGGGYMAVAPSTRTGERRSLSSPFQSQQSPEISQPIFEEEYRYALILKARTGANSDFGIDEPTYRYYVWDGQNLTAILDSDDGTTITLNDGYTKGFSDFQESAWWHIMANPGGSEWEDYAPDYEFWRAPIRAFLLSPQKVLVQIPRVRMRIHDSVGSADYDLDVFVKTLIIDKGAILYEGSITKSAYEINGGLLTIWNDHRSEFNYPDELAPYNNYLLAKMGVMANDLQQEQRPLKESMPPVLEAIADANYYNADGTYEFRPTLSTDESGTTTEVAAAISEEGATTSLLTEVPFTSYWGFSGTTLDLAMPPTNPDEPIDLVVYDGAFGSIPTPLATYQAVVPYTQLKELHGDDAEIRVIRAIALGQ